MFNDMFNFGCKRTIFQAIGFYITYLLFVVFATVVLVLIYSSTTGSNVNINDANELLEKIMPIMKMVNILYSGALAILVGRKKFLNGYMVAAAVVVSLILGNFGAAFGLVIPSILTTAPPKENNG